jgi:hypothetical protein
MSEMNNQLVNELYENFELYLPRHVIGIRPEFSFSLEAILEDALGEGYIPLYGLTPNERCSGDKYIFIAHNGAITFYTRKYYKGKPGREFHTHRDSDNPAYYSNTIIQFYKNGEVSRGGNLPASYISGVEISWNMNGKWHREDGPAIVNSLRGKYWYLNHEAYQRSVPVGDQMVTQRFAGYVDGIGNWVEAF